MPQAVLPIAAAICLLLGTLLLVGMIAVPTLLLGALLIGVGLASAVATFGLFTVANPAPSVLPVRTRYPRRSVAPRATPPSAPVSLIPPRTAGSVLAPAPAPRGAPAVHPVVGVTSASPGEQVWVQWDRAERLDGGQLPGPLVGPVPETAYFPTEADSLDPFAGRAPEYAQIGGALVPLSANTAAEEYQPTTAEVLGAGSEWNAVLSQSNAQGFEFTIEDLHGPLALSYQTQDWVAIEALHPSPPHLRAEAKAGKSAPGVRSTRNHACASCDRTLDAPSRWGSCPDCRRPVCTDCRRKAVVAHGSTHCSGCAEETPTVPSRHGSSHKAGTRRPPSPEARKVAS